MKTQFAEPKEAMEFIPQILRLKKILVPVDFSETSKKAFQYALGFVEQFDCEITLLNVVEPISAMIGEPLGVEAFPDAKDELSTAERNLAALVAESHTNGANAINSSVHIRHAPNEITKAAKDLDVGNRNDWRWRFTRMVVDVSAIRLAIHRARGRADQRHLFLWRDAAGILREGPFLRLRAFKADKCRQRAGRTLFRTPMPGLRSWNRATQPTNSRLNRQHTDLIVVGTHQRHGLGRVLLGSVSRAVLHHANVAVAVVPPIETAVQKQRK